MYPALAADTRRAKKHIHQHGLAAAHVAENVDALYGIAGAPARAEQPAEGSGPAFARTGELHLERSQHAHDFLLHRIAFNEPSRHARCIVRRYRIRWLGKVKHGNSGLTGLTQRAVHK